MMLTLCCAAVGGGWALMLPNTSHQQHGEGCNPPLVYKQIHNMNKMVILTKQYYVQPYLVGKDKRSLALILPSKLVKALNINPLTVLFLLKVSGNDQLNLVIVRQELIESKVAKDATSNAATKQEVDG